MDTISKRTTLIISGLTAIVFSRTMLMMIDDPEGPNLLIVAVLALVVYSLAFWAVRLIAPSISGTRRLLSLILAQVVAGFVLYLLMSL